MDWKNFQKDGKSFGAVLKIWPKILPSFPHGYHTSLFQNIAIPAMASSPHIFKISPTDHMESFLDW